MYDVMLQESRRQYKINYTNMSKLQVGICEFNLRYLKYRTTKQFRQKLIHKFKFTLFILFNIYKCRNNDDSFCGHHSICANG